MMTTRRDVTALAVRPTPIHQLLVWLHSQLGDVGYALVLSAALLAALAIVLIVIIRYELFWYW